MLDGQVRRLINPALDVLGARLAGAGVTANSVTVAGCAIGLGAAAAIALQFYMAGLVLILFSRLCDGLDGAIAKATRPTDFGGYLDIVLDFVFYGAIPLGFAIAVPAANAIAGAVLILSFYVNGSTFLAFAILAERHNMISNLRGDKSLYFTTGLAEATETIAVLAAMCLFPGSFAILAYVFAAVCFYTALSRIVLAARMFSRL